MESDKPRVPTMIVWMALVLSGAASRFRYTADELADTAERVSDRLTAEGDQVLESDPVGLTGPEKTVIRESIEYWFEESSAVEYDPDDGDDEESKVHPPMFLTYGERPDDSGLIAVGTRVRVWVHAVKCEHLPRTPDAARRGDWSRTWWTSGVVVGINDWIVVKLDSGDEVSTAPWFVTQYDERALAYHRKAFAEHSARVAGLEINDGGDGPHQQTVYRWKCSSDGLVFSNKSTSGSFIHESMLNENDVFTKQRDPELHWIVFREVHTSRPTEGAEKSDFMSECFIESSMVLATMPARVGRTRIELMTEALVSCARRYADGRLPTMNVLGEMVFIKPESATT